MGVPEPGAAAAASGVVTITASPTEAGTIHLYIAGEHVPVNVAASDTVTNIAAAIANEINLTTDLPVTATSTAGAVTLTARWKSVTGNDIRIDLNYYGTIGGEQTPPGLGLTLPAGAAGTVANGTGTGSGTSLTVSAVTGNIGIGSTIAGTGVPVGT